MELRDRPICTVPGDLLRPLPGQSWCILGANRSGIAELLARISGRTPGIEGSGSLPDPEWGIVSFEDQQAIYEAELRQDDTDFMDRPDPGTPAREFLTDIPGHEPLIRALDMTSCLDTGFRHLSSGQARKLMILSRITRGATRLLLQAPYDGLDVSGCRALNRALAHLHHQGIPILVFVHNPEDVPEWVTHVALVRNHTLVWGPRDQTDLAQWSSDTPSGDIQTRVPEFWSRNDSEPEMLVCLKNGRAGYGDRVVFENLNLTLRTGDHTLITGPNGSGKSTLIQVITGDHGACYQNDLTLFGIRRGSGESLWDIRQPMGILSPELHRDYRVPGSLMSCVLSGLFDSIGLYRTVTPAQTALARAWLARLGMTREADRPFRELTHADQRLILLARAMIKQPRLLILDEPTQGLDARNRTALLDLLEAIAADQLSTILYVSHRTDEYRDFFCQHLHLTRRSHE